MTQIEISLHHNHSWGVSDILALNMVKQGDVLYMCILHKI